MKKIVSRTSEWLEWLVGIFALGFILRLLGIGYGLPYLSHPDEARIILDTLSMGQRLSLLPQMPDYALLYRYFLLLIYGIYYLLGWLCRWFNSPLDFALKFFIDPSGIYLVSRLASVIFGTGLGIPAYFIGSRIFKRRAIGAVAAIFVLFEFQLVQHSQYVLYSIVLCFVNLSAFYYIFSLLKKPNTRNFVLSGALCGLAISVQNQGIFLIPPLFAAYFILARQFGREGKNKALIKRLLVALITLGGCAVLGNFYWLFIFQKSWLRMAWMMDVTKVGFSSQAPYTYNILSMMNWLAQELIRQDLLLGLMMVCGCVYAVMRRSKEDWLFLVFIIIHLYLNSNWGFRSLHDVVSLLPIICVFAARFLVEITGRFKNKLFMPIIAALAVLPLIIQEAAADIKKMQPDTRIIAKGWIEKNIPSGACIGMDWPVLSVPVLSDIPFLLRNPSAEDYYQNHLKPRIGRQYDAYISLYPHYRIDELMYWTEEPVWPKEMPQAVRLEAAKKPVCRDLYSRFVFKDMDTIIYKDKVDYLVVTSYTWTMFLLRDDPFKRNLFKTFINDRVERNFAHANAYINDQRHGYLFYLAQQGRDFYLPLLHDDLKNVKLLKVFAPKDNLGPEIRIYQVNRSNGK